MKKPRIYVAIANFHPLVGGAETQALLLAQSLRQRGYDITIVTFHLNGTWLPKETVENVPVLRVAGRLLGRREKYPRLLQKLCYVLALVVMCWSLWRRRDSYDILHVYQLNLIALPTALACCFTGKPMLIAVRSAGSEKNILAQKKASLVAGPLDATASWLQVSGPTRLHGDLEALKRLGKLPVRALYYLLQHIHAVVIVLSSHMRSYLAANNFLLPNTQLIPNGVDITRFHPVAADTPLAERVRTVVCLSRLSYEKGIDVLLQAWRMVYRECPEAHLLILGNGPLQIQLERMTRELDITSSVTFMGVQCNVPELLSRAGLAVLPSRVEGMPNALLETMACGLPGIATRVSGSEDIIAHEVNGLLVEPEDFQSMAQALLRLLRDPALAQEYGRAARSTIERHYSLEHVTDMYIELYQYIVAHSLGTPDALPLSKSLSV